MLQTGLDTAKKHAGPPECIWDDVFVFIWIINLLVERGKVEWVAQKREGKEPSLR